MKLYQRSYAYDPGTNLQQMSSSSSVTPRRMMVSSRSNRSIDEPLYSSLDLEQKRDLDTSIDTFFDVHGNQKQTGAPALTNQWDCDNQIQRTEQLAPDGSRTLEYSVYVVQGKRSRKILERQDALGNVYHIRETVYLEELEYQTTWEGDNLVYDGEDVTDAESGEVVSPIEASHTLRIREGHRQVGERKVYTVKAGQAVDEADTLFSLDNRIDSCQARLKPSGELKSFLSYAPYGQTTQSFGETADQRYRYSGQEEEDSGLYAYGFRSYLPACYRWMNPDPAGMSGSGLNRYAMVDGNPVTYRDRFGLDPDPDQHGGKNKPLTEHMEADVVHYWSRTRKVSSAERQLSPSQDLIRLISRYHGLGPKGFYITRNRLLLHTQVMFIYDQHRTRYSRDVGRELLERFLEMRASATFHYAYEDVDSTAAGLGSLAGMKKNRNKIKEGLSLITKLATRTPEQDNFLAYADNATALNHLIYDMMNLFSSNEHPSNITTTILGAGSHRGTSDDVVNFLRHPSTVLLQQSLPKSEHDKYVITLGGLHLMTGKNQVNQLLSGLNKKRLRLSSSNIFDNFLSHPEFRAMSAYLIIPVPSVFAFNKNHNVVIVKKTQHDLLGYLSSGGMKKERALKATRPGNDYNFRLSNEGGIRILNEYMVQYGKHGT